jgi:hypothetical protein
MYAWHINSGVVLCLRMNETVAEQTVNIDRKWLVRFFSLTIMATLLIIAMTLSSHAANAQLSNTQRQALNSLIKTGYTNSYPINPPRAWCSDCPNISIPYSINLGQLLAMVPDQPRTSLDILLAPTKYQTSYGYMTIQIPRSGLDSKNPSGADTPFRVTMDGHDLYWKELQTTKDYRVLGLLFTGQDALLQIYGTQGAVTKAFPTNH